jgi:hypothetical protein
MKSYTITINDDGTCSLQDEAGKEIGTFDSLDALAAEIPAALNAETPAEPDAQTEGPTAEEAETPEQEATEPNEETAPQEGETNYAQKKGMRPKQAATMEDYFTRPPQGK